MDTGASCSCMSYSMFVKIKHRRWLKNPTPRVFTADGCDLGSIGTINLTLKLGDKEANQDFVVCRQLRRDIILGADFGKNNCAGVEWTTRHTRVLSLHGIPAIEVEENKLGLPVTASFHVKVPPRHNGVFQVNIYGDTKGTHIISANNQFLEKNPNVYQHEILIVSDDKTQPFPLVAVTNLDFTRMLHIGKGEIIRFTRPESEEVVYIVTTGEINMDPYIDTSPRNWVPPRKRKPLEPTDDRKHPNSYRINDKSWELSLETDTIEGQMLTMVKTKAKELQANEERNRHIDGSSPSQSTANTCKESQSEMLKRRLDESIQSRGTNEQGNPLP